MSRSVTLGKDVTNAKSLLSECETLEATVVLYKRGKFNTAMDKMAPWPGISSEDDDICLALKQITMSGRKQNYFKVS